MGTKEELQKELDEIKVATAHADIERTNYWTSVEQAEKEFKRTDAGKELLAKHTEAILNQQRCDKAKDEREVAIAEFFISKGTQATHSQTWGKNINPEILNAIKAAGVKLHKVKGSTLERTVNNWIYKARNEDEGFQKLKKDCETAQKKSYEAERVFDEAQRYYVETKNLQRPDSNLTDKLGRRRHEIERMLAEMGEPTTSKDERWGEQKKLVDANDAIFEKLKPKLKAFLEE